MAHCCPKKMRYLDKDNKNVQLGLMAFKRFHQLTSYNSPSKTYVDMVNSNLYNDFVSFGRWINDAAIVNPTGYIDYVIKEKIKINDWQKSSVYESFLKTMVHKEDALDALCRSIEWVTKWCDQNSVEIINFYDKIGTNTLTHYLRSAAISPWMIFLSSRKTEILSRFDESQMKLLNSLLDQTVWNLRMRKYRNNLDEYQNILGELNL